MPEEVVRVAEDIREMRIRGAGRIARAAARALLVAAEEYKGDDVEEFKSYMKRVAEYLIRTRPTAVSLPNAVSYVVSPLLKAKVSGVPEAKNLVISRATFFVKYSEEALDRIADIGSRLLRSGDTVMTHCNSQAAVSIIVRAVRSGKDVRVIATETRPLFQGHLTARMLREAGVNVTLIPDSSVRAVIREVDKVVVGADTVVANGAVVNKIGTSFIALAAHERSIEFFVAAETYKFSPYTLLGELVLIEERPPSEVLPPVLLEQYPRLRVLNPAFDVTPPEYIDAIITEVGLVPPHAAFMILEELYGREAVHDVMGGVEEDS